MNIVGIGGGTGLPVLLRGLKALRDRCSDGKESNIVVKAVVCVSDDGNSSGALRRALGIPAVGDLRNCLVALSDGSPVLRDVFQHRIGGDPGLDGHAVGNLIVAALCARSGSFRQAVRLASDLLQSQGHVLPSTEESAVLCAEFEDGAVVRGETRISATRCRIRRVWLEPPNVLPAPGVLETLASADAIVLGPGSLYTSVIPNLLPAGVAAAVRNSRALKILVCNLMTQTGETAGYSAADHVRAIQDYLGPRGVQVCLINSRPVVESKVAQQAGAGAVQVDKHNVARLGVAPICVDLLDLKEKAIRHDPIKLAGWIVTLARTFKKANQLETSRPSALQAVATLTSTSEGTSASAQERFSHT